MTKLGCPPRFIAIVWQFKNGMQARVQNNGEYREPFSVSNRIKLGCVKAPTIFSMLTDAFQD